MNDIKMFQKTLSKLDIYLIQQKKYRSKCQQLREAEHVLISFWASGTVIPPSLFWDVAKEYGIKYAKDAHIDLWHGCDWYEACTFAIKNDKPVPLEVVIGFVDTLSHKIFHMTSKQFKFFNDVLQYNIE